jgi:hypothetical protein
VVLLIGLLIGGAAAGYVLLAATRPPVGPSVTPTPTGLQADASFPTTAESDLLSQVPASIRDVCERAAEAEKLPQTTASLRCDLGLSADADSVWYHRFDSAASMAGYMASLQQERRLPARARRERGR